MIIDSLTHITPDGRWFNTSHEASLDRLMRELDVAKVERAVVVALADYIENDFVYETCQGSGGRLIPGASLNPMNYASTDEAMKAAEATLNGGDFPVLKLHPRLNGFDPLDERCQAILHSVTQLKAPVTVWLDSIFRNNNVLPAKPPVDTMQTLLHQHPDLNFVLLHGGGPLLLQMAELLLSYSNLTIDLSLTANYYRQTSLLQDIVFLLEKRDLRVCAGSDFPEFVPNDYLSLLRELCSKKDISLSKLANVLGKNVKELLER